MKIKNHIITEKPKIEKQNSFMEHHLVSNTFKGFLLKRDQSIPQNNCVILVIYKCTYAIEEQGSLQNYVHNKNASP